MINFESELLQTGPLKIIRFPIDISEKLPSRGMVMVEGEIDGEVFVGALEPDGKGSHWLEISPLLIREKGIKVGDSLSLTIEPIGNWPKPDVPEEIINYIIKENILEEWNSLTSKAQWDWVRWIRSTENKETRNKRILVACSKMKKGDRRPCCFDRTRSTVTSVSKSGVLLD